MDVLDRHPKPVPLRQQPQGLTARDFVSIEKEVPDEAAALAGARDIVAERIAEDAEVRKHARETYFKEGQIAVQKLAEQQDKAVQRQNEEREDRICY